MQKPLGTRQRIAEKRRQHDLNGKLLLGEVQCMTDRTETYDTTVALSIELEGVISLMSKHSVHKIYVKKLSPNDNSKNQPYFGFHLTDLPFIPTGEMEASQSTSNKTKDSSRKIKYQAGISLSWIDGEGCTYPAPHSKLIYYPQYPEVRFSGFLKGSKVKLSRWMAPEKQGRAENRWLLLGISNDNSVYAWLATPESNLANELEKSQLTMRTSIFGEIDIASRSGIKDTRAELLSKLLEIHKMGWISGRRLNSDMETLPYKAQNGGGYTLEAMLGVSPNGFAEPDYLGWEVKQFSVKSFPSKGAKPTTLMTPEPNGGVYTNEGAATFVRRFGYADKSGKPNRINFGGKHVVNTRCKTTNLTLKLDGFDANTQTITKADGAISLEDEHHTTAARWSFPKIMDHWKKKHSQAVYIPCMMRAAETGVREYFYGADVELGNGTDFQMFLSGMLNGFVYYDPGIKLENASDLKSTPKKRSQFRASHKHLNALYKQFEFVNIIP